MLFRKPYESYMYATSKVTGTVF